MSIIKADNFITENFFAKINCHGYIRLVADDQDN